MDNSLENPYIQSATADYWQTYLTDCEPCFFPQLTDGIIVERQNGVRQLVNIDTAGTGDMLADFCLLHNVTTADVLRTTWAVILGCYIGIEEVCFGNVMPANNGKKVFSICRAQLRKEDPVSKVLSSLHESHLRSWPHALSESKIEKQASDGQILFNSTLDFWGHEEMSWEEILTAASGIKYDTGRDIVIHIKNSGKEVEMVLEYVTFSISKQQALNLASTLKAALLAIVEDATKSPTQLNILSDRDLESIWSWNKECPEGIEECVQQYIHRQVLVRPDSIAVCASDANLTYRTLDEYSTKLAHELIGKGVKPGVIVPLCFEKSAWMVVAMLGLIKAGGGIVFLDPYYPMARLEDIIKQVDAKLVLTSHENLEMWKERIEAYEVSQDFIDALPYQEEAPETGASSSDVLFVIFTSGSTGHPKGCVTEHSAYLSAALQHGPTFKIDHSSRVLQFASYNFDLSILEVFTTLIFGACVCIPDELARSKGIASVMNEFKINWAFLTPSLVKLLKPDEVPLLKTLVLGGEAVSKSNVETWSEKVQLMDGYGPSECSIVAAIHSSLTLNSDASNIGRAVGGKLWVVDASDYHKLVPIGAIGELAIEGPNLARGYLNNPEKTAASFVRDPAWMVAVSPKRQKRLYMTGDLARLCSDGSIAFVGRKDTQVKVRGQRVELGEIEHHIAMDSLVKHVMVIMPAAGLRKNRLVAALSFHNTEASSAVQELKLINVQKNGLFQELASIRNYVSARVPGYMVPETWIVVEALPFNSSAKIDRMKVKRWTETMSEEDYREIGITDTKETLDGPTTEMGAQLQEVVSHVLNLSLQSVVMNRSFLNLGGDSISAMQVMTQCKAKGIALKIKDILRYKTLTELALCMKPTEQSKLLEDEDLDTPFELTPIQQFYFQLESEGSVAGSQHRYNQSFMLRLTRNVPVRDMAKAIDSVVQRHSMLRARFRKVKDGNPTQYTIPATQQSYRFNERNVTNKLMVEQLVVEAQDTIDIWSGPVFSADLFNGSEGQLLFLVAHHAVVDLVSWRIIMQEIQEILENGMAPTTKEKPIPYQIWTKLQAEYARQNLAPQKVLPFKVPPFNMDYWGLSSKDNKIRDTIRKYFVIDVETTSKILGPISHHALRTEPIDIFLSALIHSFSKVFKDREAPTIFREGHGREPWNDDIDISSTVGWFTSIYPVHVEPAADIVETVRRMKDTQRSIPGKGWPYFASRYNHPEGISQFGNHLFSEIQFDYLGLYQQLERDDAFLQYEPWVVEDVGRDVQRFSMFEVTAEVLQGQLRFTFEFNRKMKHQLGISNWIAECENSLRLAADSLAAIQDVQYTLSDFPLLSIDQRGLDKLANTVLPRLGISSLEAVEDAYPTSPMQTGLLLSQARAERWYQYYNVFEARSTIASLKVDVSRLQDAWQRVVNRHSSLRTVFVEGIAENSAFDQIVLKTIDARVVHVKCEQHNLKETLDMQQSIPLNDTQPPHRMTICETPTGEVFFRLDINHALVDGMSILALIRDLAIEYDGRTSPSKAPLYSDYISYLQGWHAEAGLEYWREYLTGVEPSYFPILNDGVVQEDLLETFQLEHQFTVAELNSLCMEMNITLSTLFQAAWALVLQNYTGLDEVCFGYLVSGRELPIDNINDGVGAFINILVSRLDMSQSMTQLLEQVQGDYANSIPYQHCSLADIQHCLDTDLEGRSLFNSIVNVQRGTIQDGDSSISLKFLYHHDPVEYDIAWDISVASEKTEIDLKYRTSRLSSDQAHGVAGCFEKALMSIMDAFQRNIPATEVDLFGERDKKQIWSWNQNLPPRVAMCAHVVIEEQVKAYPDSPAICSWDGEYTYNQLDKMSTKLAYHLVSMKVGPEVIVALCFEKSAWTIVAMLAVMKAGGAFVLLDPSQTSERLGGLINDLHVHHLLTSQQHSGLLAGLVDTIYVVNGTSLSELKGPEAGSNSRPCTTVKPENPMHVIFTSGTTGKPKGSLTEHAAFCTSAAAHSKILHMLPTSRALQYASYVFDACILEIITTLMVGGCVCVPSDQERLEDLAGMMNRTSVNWAFLTPTVARFLSPSQVTGLKTLALVGEMMSSSDLSTWRGAVNIINGYGPSECSILAACNDNIKDEVANIGTAVGGICWIVDPKNHNRLKPIGCVGELLIEGSTLARKYVNDKKKTAEVFITNPSWLVEGRGESQVAHRLYKTGDLVRYNSDGTMIFLGRRDTQLKIHGQRIEVGEIEHHLLQRSPSISRVAVDVFNHAERQGKQALVAYFTCVDEASEDNVTNNNLVIPLSEHTVAGLSTLQTSLADVLPSYMIPSVFISVKNLPVSATGKLDRKKLRQLAESLSAEQLNHYSLSSFIKRAPGTLLERRLQLLWAEVLGVSAGSLGADDSFFRVGGDSIIAMRLVAAARKNHIILTVAKIFNYPRLCDMASVTEIEDDDWQSQLRVGQFAILKTENSVEDLLNDVAVQCGVDKHHIKDIYPCTPLQEALMALTLKQHGAYVARSVFRLPETINVSRFRQAWERTVEELPILRTRIVNLEAEGSLQVVLDDEITWKTAEVLDEYLYKDQQTDIIYGGLLSRYGLVRSQSHWYFIWTIHHALYDGWSQSLVFEQVQREYEGQSIPALVPFNHFIKYLSTSDSKSCENFWRSELDGEIPATFPQLPSATYQPQANKVSVHSIHFNRNPETDILLSTIIRAAWPIVIARYTDAEEIVFGMTVSGRNAPVPDIEAVVGPTVTTVPIKVRVDRQQAVSEFLTTIQAQAARIIPFEHWGLQNISRLSKNAQFQNLLVIQPGGAFESKLMSAELVPTYGETFSNYALCVECIIAESGMELKVTYDDYVLPDVQPLLHQFEHVMRQLIASGNYTKLGDISLCSPEDEMQIWRWNDSYPKPVEESINTIIDKWTVSNPGAPAICAWDTNLSYAELDRLSARLSQHLVSLGVGPEIIVPLCFEKSAWVVVAMLAVLKAGGAICLLDPSHPIKRLQEIASTVKATVLLTSPFYFELSTSLCDELIVVDEQSINAIGSEDRRRISSAVKPTHAAYVVFTSGTTGKPKGSITTHSALASNGLAIGDAFKISSSSRVLQYTSFSYDPYIIEILVTLMHGGCVCIIEEEVRTNIPALVRAINDMNVSFMTLTPSVARLIQKEEVPTVTRMALGGESMAEDDKAWSETLTLMNAYGPSECTVMSLVNAHITVDADRTNIGKAVGGVCWIVEPHNHNALAPVGCIGELLIEGPLLSRGYINEKAKTADVFIENPTWLREKRPVSRLYKTGDLVRYNPDGSINHIGRKDLQVKLHGQRLELGEIEHHLSTHELISSAAVLLPKSGYCKGRLVAVMSLTALVSTKTVDYDLHLAKKINRDALVSHVAEVRAYLEDQLPAYMVPSVWAMVDDMPLSKSAKLDKQKIATWLENLREEEYLEIMDLDTQGVFTAAITPMESRFQEVLSRVLNQDIQKVTLNRSFLNLGGDSITAMHVMARCRAEGITVKIKDIMQSKSISQLAACAKESGSPMETSKEESFDTQFDLSPIQEMYFQTNMGGTTKERAENKVGEYRFNQSSFLRLRRATELDALAKAIEALVGRHSMLRARFAQSNGRWTQRVLKQVSGAYRFEAHTFNHMKDVASIISASQSSLDPENGPVFTADVFQDPAGKQLIFLAAHHLVVDVVSWRVLLQDLEMILCSDSLLFQKSLPFQTWCTLQAEYFKSSLSQANELPFKVTPGNYDYWDFGDRVNVYGDSLEVGFTLGPEVTSKLLGDCHAAFKTQPVDIFLSALIQSFNQIFPDRSIPPVFSEGHGREPWNSDIDLSGTVGWFTTIFPVQIPIDNGSDILETVRLTKDTRSQIKDNGWSYFASRFMKNDVSNAFGDHWPMEVVFNYLGLRQELERDDGLLQHVSLQNIGGSITDSTSDVGSKVRRLGLFEVTAEVDNGLLKVHLVYNRHVRHQSKIQDWMAIYEKILVGVTETLPNMETQPTLSDFPLLSLTYSGLEKIQREQLPKMGLSSWNEVEDIYPCSPTQQGILISQSRSPHNYKVHTTYEVFSMNDEPVDVLRLQNAWQKVVARHAMLRTVFMNSASTKGLFDQVVLKTFNSRIFQIECGDSDALNILNRLPSADYTQPEPPHCLTICKTERGVYMKLEISHALMDRLSMDILLQDLSFAYDEKLLFPGKKPLLYSDYISYVQAQPQDKAREYWRRYLDGVEPCHFPTLGEGDGQDVVSIQVDFSMLAPAIFSFCQKQGLTTSNLFQVAWGLVLRSYTNLEQVCFGYLTSGRDAPVEGIQEAVGVICNMMVCRLDLSKRFTLKQLLKAAQDDWMNGLQYQHTSLATIQHQMGFSGQALFNTGMSFMGKSKDISQKSPAISFTMANAHDPSEYDIILNITALDSDLDVTLSYQPTLMSVRQAENVGSVLVKVLRSILDTQEGYVDDLDLISEQHYRQIVAWNNAVPKHELSESSVINIIKEQIVKRADAPAVCSWDGNFSYSELDILSTRLANYLTTLGIGPDKFVPVCMEKSKWVIVAMLAIIKAGGAFVPMDAEQTGRFDTIVRMTNASTVLTSARYSQQFSKLVEAATVVDDNLMSKILSSNQAPSQLSAPSNAIYILFTSGSTGEPKGVVVENEAYCASMLGQIQALGMNHRTRILQFSSYSFDVCVLEILTTLMVGGCICMPSDSERLDDLAGVIRKLEVNMVALTPSVAKLLSPEEVPSLQTIMLGGESPAKETIRQWQEKAKVVLAYGPTECSCSCSFVTNVTTQTDNSSIGMPNMTNFWIVDASDHNKLVPVGAIGELLIEGPLLARGYLNNPTQTAAVFIENPEWSQSLTRGTKTRMYKTGDLVRYYDDGSFKYLGRKDTQVKLRGQRIELGEVEHHLRRAVGKQYEVVAEVLRFGNDQKDSVLAGFISLGDGFDGDENLANLSVLTRENLSLAVAGVESRMSETAPLYMIPSVFIPVKSIPLAPSLKTDRRKLRLMASCLSKAQLTTLSAMNSATSTTMTETEKRMQRLWASVLDIDPSTIKPSDKFYNIGGDSIIAIKLVAACRNEEPPITLSVVDILRNPTLSSVCRSLGTMEVVQQREEPISALDPLSKDHSLKKAVYESVGMDKSNIEDLVEATSMQSSFTTTGLLTSRGNTNYFIFSLTGPINSTQLEESCRKLVSNHPILRTVFVTYQRQLWQVILRSITLQFRNYKCKPKKLTSLAAKLAKADQAERMSLGDPIVRFMFLDGGNQSLLLMRISHTQYDGMSVPILIEDLATLYEGKGLPKRPTFSEFVHCAQASNAAGAEDYWYSQLKGSSMTNIVSHKSPPYCNTNVKTITREVPSVDTQEFGMTFATVLKAAWALVLAQLSGQTDVVFGHVISGRNMTLGSGDINKVLGPCVNMVPVRVRLESSTNTVMDLLRQVHQQQLDAIPFETFGLQNIVEQCTEWPLWTRFSSVVQHQNLNGVEDQVKTFQIGEAQGELGAIAPAYDSADIMVVSWPNGSSIKVDLLFSDTLIPSDFANTIMEKLCKNIQLLSENTHDPLPPATTLFSSPPQIPILAKNAKSLQRQVDASIKPTVLIEDHHLMKPSASPQSMVEHAWNIILSTKEDPIPNKDVGSHTCFFNVWGSLLAAAQFAEYYTKLGFEVSMEDIIENPTMHLQSVLLSNKMSGTQQWQRSFFKNSGTRAVVLEMGLRREITQMTVKQESRLLKWAKGWFIRSSKEANISPE